MEGGSLILLLAFLEFGGDLYSKYYKYPVHQNKWVQHQKFIYFKVRPTSKQDLLNLHLIHFLFLFSEISHQTLEAPYNIISICEKVFY